MLVPEFLFKLTRLKDVSQQQLAVVTASVVGSDTNSPSAVATIFQNTGDEVVVLSNVVAYTDSDAELLRVDDIQIFKSAIAPGAVQHVIAYKANQRPTGAQAFPGTSVYQQDVLNWNGQFWLMPGELLGISSFSEDAGGATEHRVLGYCHGIRIPRANITRG